MNTASMAGLMTSPGSAPYSAAKHAVIGLTKALRGELAIKSPHVGVSVICPGEIATDMADRIRTKGTAKDAAHLDALRARLTVAMAPIDVGRLLITAIREKTFWVLPNGPGHLPAVQQELDELMGRSAS